MGIAPAHILDEFDFFRCMLVRMRMGLFGTVTQRVRGAVIAVLPAINILSVYLVFNSSFRNAIFFSIVDEG